MGGPGDRKKKSTRGSGKQPTTGKRGASDPPEGPVNVKRSKSEDPLSTPTKATPKRKTKTSTGRLSDFPLVDVNQPPPKPRFEHIAPRAVELFREVKVLFPLSLAVSVFCFLFSLILRTPMTSVSRRSFSGSPSHFGSGGLKMLYPSSYWTMYVRRVGNRSWRVKLESGKGN